MGGKLLKFLKWSALGSIGLLVVWTVRGNFLAAQQEKEIERDLERFAQQFPKTEPNDSALKLTALIAKLGRFGGGDVSPITLYRASQADFTPSETNREAWDEIKDELKEYLDSQIVKPNDEIDLPSEKLQRYLASQKTTLDDIRSHVMNNEVPHWGTDITWILEGYQNWPMPSLLYLVDVQRILALDILEKHRQGQTQAAAEMLEVSWKINQSLRNNPLLIGQLVALIMSRYQAGVMRKLDNLPAEWQERLVEHDYRESIRTFLKGEFLYQFRLMQNFDSYSREELESLDVPSWIGFLGLIGKPYLPWVAIDIYHAEMQGITQGHEQNVCSYDLEAIDATPSWWNITPWNSLGNIFKQEFKSAQYMLELELTQKTLHIKGLAAKEGKWPESVSDLESSICPGATWIYQVSDDGTMSISFSELSDWLEERIERGLPPLTYSDRTLPDS